MMQSEISEYMKLQGKKILKLIRTDFAMIIIFYLLVYTVLLINDGIFFDDWVIFNVDKETVVNMYTSCGNYWFGYFINLIFSICKHIFLFRLIVFICYLFSARLLYNVIKDIKEINDFSRLIIIAFFILFPVNFARIFIAIVNYAVCHFLFFFAFWLLSIYMKNKNIWLRALCLLLFFISFSMNSLLFFYLLVIMYIYYCEKENIKTIYRLLFSFLRYIDFFILPIFFWVFKIFFLKPTNIYTQYNVVTLKRIFSAPLKTIIVFNTSFLQPLNQTIAIFLRYPTEILVLSLIIISFLKIKYKIQEDNRYDCLFFLFGFITFFVGVFPYLSVGQTLSIYEWESRHQILVPLGASFILYYGIRIFAKELNLNFYIQHFIYSLFIAMFISTNFLFYLEYQKDWFKQLSLMENFKNSEILRDNTTFLFDDKTTELNARKREYRFYEYTGLMKHVFGDERRFGTKAESAFENFSCITNFKKAPPNIKHILLRRFNISDYTVKQAEYKVIINYGNYRLNNHTVIKLIFLRIINPLTFKEKIKNVVKLEYFKL